MPLRKIVFVEGLKKKWASGQAKTDLQLFRVFCFSQLFSEKRMTGGLPAVRLFVSVPAVTRCTFSVNSGMRRLSRSNGAPGVRSPGGHVLFSVIISRPV